MLVRQCTTPKKGQHRESSGVQSSQRVAMRSLQRDPLTVRPSNDKQLDRGDSERPQQMTEAPCPVCPCWSGWGLERRLGSRKCPQPVPSRAAPGSMWFHVQTGSTKVDRRQVLPNRGKGLEGEGVGGVGGGKSGCGNCERTEPARRAFSFRPNCRASSMQHHAAAPPQPCRPPSIQGSLTWCRGLCACAGRKGPRGGWGLAPSQRPLGPPAQARAARHAYCATGGASCVPAWLAGAAA